MLGVAPFVCLHLMFSRSFFVPLAIRRLICGGNTSTRASKETPTNTPMPTSPTLGAEAHQQAILGAFPDAADAI